MAMRVGAENKTKLYLAVGLGAVVLILAVYQIYSIFFASSPAPAPVATTAAPAPVAAPVATQASVNSSAAVPYAHEAKQLPSASALDPTLHPEVMAQAEATAYTGNGRNIFSANSVAPPPVIEKVVAPVRPSESLPPAPPPPPPIDLKFYGYSSAHSGQRQIFLLHGDDIFLAHEGDVVDRRYRVVAIRPLSVEVEDIPYHNTQTLPLTQN